MKNAIAIAAVAGIATAATAQSFSLVPSAASINEGDSYTVDLVMSAPAGFSAIAGFEIVITVDNGTISNASLAAFLNTAPNVVVAGNTVTFGGGQLPAAFGGGNAGTTLASFQVDGATAGFSNGSSAQGSAAPQWFSDAGGFAGTEFQASYGGSSVEVVPTPAAAALLGLGGLVAARRRR